MRFLLKPVEKVGEWYLRLMGVRGSLELNPEALAGDWADLATQQARASVEFCFAVIRMTRLLLHYGTFAWLFLLGLAVAVRALWPK